MECSLVTRPRRQTSALILAAGPLIGLTSAAFLPFIGIAMVIKLSFAKLFGRFADRLSRMATFNGRPPEAYLAGRRHTKKRPGNTDLPKKRKCPERKRNNSSAIIL